MEISEKQKKFMNHFESFLLKRGKNMDKQELSEILVGIGLLTYQDQEGETDPKEFLSDMQEKFIEEERYEEEHVESFEKPTWKKNTQEASDATLLE